MYQWNIAQMLKKYDLGCPVTSNFIHEFDDTLKCFLDLFLTSAEFLYRVLL